MASTPSYRETAQPAARPSSPILIGLAWALVVIPTAWGLTFTVENALKLFHAPPPAASTPAAPTSAPAR